MPPQSTLVVMEASGHYWQNLFAALVAKGFAVALVNPLRTHRFAGEELARTSVECLQIARFGAQKRPAPSQLPEAAVEELREPMRLRERLMQELVARLNQLHRLVDLGFPEFTRYLKDLNTELATAILHQYPTAQAFRGVLRRRLAKPSYDGRDRVGAELAQQLIEAAAISVGSQHSPSHQLGVRYACENLETLGKRLKRLDEDVAGTLRQHQIGQLLTSVGGIGDTTAAMIVAELARPGALSERWRAGGLRGRMSRTQTLRQASAKELVAQSDRESAVAAWFMDADTQRCHAPSNPWLMVFYRRLIERSKPHKVALCAAMRKLLAAICSVAKHRRPFKHGPKPGIGAEN